MEEFSEDSQINKKPRLGSDETMSKQQVSDERGDSHSNNIGDDDDAINGLTCEIELIHLIDDKVDTMGSELESLQRGVAALAEQIDARDLYTDLLSQSLVKKDKDITTLRNKVYDLERRSMNKNISIQNLPERPKEVARETVKTYLQNHNIDSSDYNIEVAHRTGRFDAKNAWQRPMIVEFAKRGQVDTVMEGTKGDGDFNRDETRVSRQVPTEARHATAKLFHIAKLIKENHPQANVSVKDKNIYVNNNKKKNSCNTPNNGANAHF